MNDVHRLVCNSHNSVVDSLLKEGGLVEVMSEGIEFLRVECGQLCSHTLDRTHCRLGEDLRQGVHRDIWVAVLEVVAVASQCVEGIVRNSVLE